MYYREAYYHPSFFSKMNKLCDCWITFPLFIHCTSYEVVENKSDDTAIILFYFKFLFWKKMIGCIDVRNYSIIHNSAFALCNFMERYCCAYQEGNDGGWIGLKHCIQDEVAMNEEDIKLRELEKKYS